MSEVCEANLEITMSPQLYNLDYDDVGKNESPQILLLPSLLDLNTHHKLDLKGFKLKVTLSYIAD